MCFSGFIHPTFYYFGVRQVQVVETVISVHGHSNLQEEVKHRTRTLRFHLNRWGKYWNKLCERNKVSGGSCFRAEKWGSA